MSLRRTIIALVLLCAGAAQGAILADSAAVSSPERLSTATGLNVLRSGGTAADAAVAIAFTLSVLRPESAGILGGGTALYYDAPSGEVWALDFRRELPNPLYVEGDVARDAPSLAVPGLPRGLHALHRKFGSSDWASLMRPASALARELPRSGLPEDATLMEASREGGRARSEQESGVGTEAILSRLAERGADEVYLGETARQLVARSREAGGTISPRSLAEYAPRWKSPLRIDFRGDGLYTMAPPAGAGNVLTEMIRLLSGFDWRGRSWDEPETIHLFVEAERYSWSRASSALSDREATSRQMARSPEELATVRERIERAPLDGDTATIADRPGHTIGFVVVDERGSAAVVSLSMGPADGSGVRLGAGTYIAEAPASSTEETSMPLLILRDDRLKLVINGTGAGRGATVGGSLYLRSALMNGDLEDLIEAPRFIPGEKPRTIICEKGTPFEMVDGLNAMGHGVEWQDVTGTVHAIEIGEHIAAISDSRGGTAGGY